MRYRLEKEEQKAELIKSVRKAVNRGTYMKKETNKKAIIKKVLIRTGITFVSVLLVLVIGAVGAVSIIHYGPSNAARDILVLSAMETSAGHFLATWFLPDELIETIIDNNSVVPTTVVTNPNLIQIPDDDNPGDEPGTDEKFDKTKVEIFDVAGKTYKGKVLVVNDPSRVYVGTPAAFGRDKEGIRIKDAVTRDNALAAVNGGGFEDINGKGNGGIPEGIVMSKGKLMWGNKNTKYEVIGFDENNILIVGNMTAQEALDKKIRDAVTFGPILIVNGEPCEIKGTGGGLNPRTAIGQRADGAVLLLVVDGRQANSPGATFSDLVDILLNFGAVNAANLDGGASSYMVYENEVITTPATLYQPRRMATLIMVSRIDEKG